MVINSCKVRDHVLPSTTVIEFEGVILMGTELKQTVKQNANTQLPLHREQRSSLNELQNVLHLLDLIRQFFTTNKPSKCEKSIGRQLQFHNKCEHKSLTGESPVAGNGI